PIGDPRRGPYLKWLFFGPSCFEPAVVEIALKREPAPQAMVGWGDLSSVLEVIAKGVEKGPFLLGDRFTAADVIIRPGIRSRLMWKLIPERPELVAYAGRLGQRPAAHRAAARDQ